MIKLEEQPIVKPEDYLFNTWIERTKTISTEKGDVTILEILTDFRKHLLQNLDHNKKAYHQDQLKETITNLCKCNNPIHDFKEDLTLNTGKCRRCGKETKETFNYRIEHS